MLAIYCSISTSQEGRDKIIYFHPQEKGGLKYVQMTQRGGDFRIYRDVITFQDITCGNRSRPEYDRMKIDIAKGRIDEVWAVGSWYLHPFGHDRKQFEALCEFNGTRIRFQDSLERSLLTCVENSTGMVEANEIILRRVERIVYKRPLSKEDFETIIEVMMGSVKYNIRVTPLWRSIVQDIDRWLAKNYRGYNNAVIRVWKFAFGLHRFGGGSISAARRDGSRPRQEAQGTAFRDSPSASPAVFADTVYDSRSEGKDAGNLLLHRERPKS